MTTHIGHFKSLVKTLRYNLIGAQFFRAADALEYGLNIHTGVRKDGITPEYQHQVEIALYVLTLRTMVLFPEDTIVTALLHDTTEDYFVNNRYISDRFGQRCGDAVFLLDKNGKTEEDYFRGIANNAITSIVKSADRMHNVRTMPGAFKHEKQLRYINEVRTLFLPMLKLARRQFSAQTDAYENIKYILNIQLDSFEYYAVPINIPISV